MPLRRAGPLIPLVLGTSFSWSPAEATPTAQTCPDDTVDCEVAPRVSIAQPIGSVRITTGQSIEGEPRYPRRSMPADGVVVVEFVDTPQQLVPLSNDVPPPLDALAGRPELQRQFNRQARPGQFVTPPAVAM